MSSLLTLNYFTPFPSFIVVEFKQVNVCWKNYLRFYSFDIYFNVSTGEKAGLNKKLCREFRYFSYLTHSVRCNLASLRLLKQFIQGTLESLYKCDHQILGTQ